MCDTPAAMPSTALHDGANFALSAAHVLLRGDDTLPLGYAAELLGVSRKLFDCASEPAKPFNTPLETAG